MLSIVVVVDLSPLPDLELADTRRSSLLDAAVGVFARYGFRKASMDEVARAAGVSRQGLYLQFANKEELFREALAHALRSQLNAAIEALSKAQDSLESRWLPPATPGRGASSAPWDRMLQISCARVRRWRAPRSPTMKRSSNEPSPLAIAESRLAGFLQCRGLLAGGFGESVARHGARSEAQLRVQAGNFPVERDDGRRADVLRAAESH